MVIKEPVTVTYDREIKCLCDMCGEQIIERSYNVMYVEVHARRGTSYPEGGHGTEFKPDICLKCFIERVEPALRAIGFKHDVIWTKWDS